MKREQIIETLVVKEKFCDRKLLISLSNARLRAIYASIQNKHCLRQNEANAMIKRLRAEGWRPPPPVQDWWSGRKWIHPKVKYPLSHNPRPVLQFGVEDLLETATWMAKHYNNKDAQATIRMIKGKTHETIKQIRTGHNIQPGMRQSALYEQAPC